MDQPHVRDASAARLGQRLRRARLSRNLTQSEVAQRQFSVSYISAVERGQIRPSLGALERLADRLQVPLSDLMREDDSLPIPPVIAAERGENSAARDEFESRLLEAQVLARQGQADAALAVLARLGNQTLQPREQVLVQWQRAYSYIAARQGEQARHELQEAIPAAERLGDAELRARLHNEMGNALRLTHKHQLALEHYREALDAIEQGSVKDPTFHLQVLYNIGTELWQLDDHAAAVEYLGQAAAIAEEVLNPERLGAIFWSLNTALAAQNDTRRAREYARRSLAAYEDAGNQRLAGEVYTQLGRAYTHASRIEDALAHLVRARQMAEQQHDVRGVIEAQRGLVAVYLQQGQTEDALRATEDAIRRAEGLEDAVLRGETLLARANVRNALGQATQAEGDYEQAIESLSAADAPQQLSDAYAQYSAFLETRGESQRALGLLKQAWQLKERAGVMM